MLKGQPDLIATATARARELLANPPLPHIPAEADQRIRDEFDIRLGTAATTGSSHEFLFRSADHIV